MDLREGDEFIVPKRTDVKESDSFGIITRIPKNDNPNERYEVKWTKGNGSITWPRNEFEIKFKRGTFILTNKRAVYEVYC